MSSFDPYNWEDFFFGALGREESKALLKNAPVGSFLLRESNSRFGYSLSIRECLEGDHQIYHYFVERKLNENKVQYEICGNVFIDIPSLIMYYQIHVLEQSCLLQPIRKQAVCNAIGIYRFDGEKNSDLSFERGEGLEIIGKSEELWWLARNSLGNIGLIPVPYIKYGENDINSVLDLSASSSFNSSAKRFSTTSNLSEVSLPCCNETQQTSGQKTSQNDLSENKTADNSNEISPQSIKLNFPIKAHATADWFPSVYDTDALMLKRGQLIYVAEILLNGFCRGRRDDNERIGLFPISYVEWDNKPLK